MSKGKISLGVIGAFFILFILFVAFHPAAEMPTGATTFGVGQSNFLTALGDCTPGLYNYSSTLLEGAINYTINITGTTSQEQCKFLVKTLNYTLNSTWNNKNMSCKAPSTDLQEISTNDFSFNNYLKQETFLSSTKDCNGTLQSYFYAAYNADSTEGIFEIPFFAGIDFAVENGVMSNPQNLDTFYKGQYIWCIANFSAEGVVNISFYGPSDPVSTPDKTFADVGNEANQADFANENAEGAICALDVSGDYKLCGAIYIVDEYKPGKWQCLARYKSSTKNQTFVSELRPVMISEPPTQIEQIPNFSVSTTGGYSRAELNLDMSNFFEDGDTSIDDLGFIALGAQYLDIELDQDNWIEINNPKNFQGTEMVYFKVSDDDTSIYSNNFTITVGTGTYIPPADSNTTGCIADWRCGPWSNCVDGQQIRACTDVNMCGSELDKPTEINSCGNVAATQTEITPSISMGKLIGPATTLLWVVFSIGVLAIIVGVILFFIKRKKKENINNFSFKNESTEVKPFEYGSISDAKREIQGEMLGSQYSPEDIISKGLDANKSIEVIVNELIGKGVDRNTANNKVILVKAKRIIQERLKQGFSREKIIESFKAKGWREEQIAQLFK